MIKRSFFAAAIVTALGLPGIAPAAAQSITSPYEFVEGAHAFYAFGSAVFTDRGTLDTGPGSGYAVGLGYNFRLSGPFNLGVRVSYLPTDRRVYTDSATLADSLALRADPMTKLYQVGTADVTLLLLDASLRFDVTGPRTWHRIQPYVVMGGGGALVLSQGNDGEDQLPPDIQLQVRFRDGWTGHVGAGFEVHFTDHLSARFDARDVLWKIHIPPGFVSTGRVIDQEQWVQSAHLTLGLTLRL